MFGSLLPTRKVVFVRLIWAWCRLAGVSISGVGTRHGNADRATPQTREVEVQECICATRGKCRLQIRFATAQCLFDRGASYVD